MFDIGFPELMLILILVLIFYGPGKLPEIARSLGKAISEFKKAASNLASEIETATDKERVANADAQGSDSVKGQ